MDARSSSAVRVDIVGAGFAASSHIDALRRIPHVRAAGILASVPDRTAAAAQRLGVDAVTSLDELLDRVDVVHNCTPNDVHASVTEAALGADVHVLSEKPLGLGAAEASRLARTAGEASVVTDVCFNYRHFPLVQEMRALLAAGGDGPVHLVHGAYLQDWLLHREDWNWRLESSRAGASRATGDIGSHWIDLMQHVTGDEIASLSSRRLPGLARRRSTESVEDPGVSSETCVRSPLSHSPQNRHFTAASWISSVQ
jgi:predicted dehydrogenase